jgi:hypothetical protein
MNDYSYAADTPLRKDRSRKSCKDWGWTCTVNHTHVYLPLGTNTPMTRVE